MRNCTLRIFAAIFQRTELLEYIREVMNFLNMFLNHKSKHAIKGATPEIEKKQDEFICESNPSEKYE